MRACGAGLAAYVGISWNPAELLFFSLFFVTAGPTAASTEQSKTLSLAEKGNPSGS